jgi:hypothetical protein
MPNSPPRKRPPLEVTVMFEPHRQQHALLQAAYAALLPEPRRRLASEQGSALTPQANLQDRRRERKAP